MKPDWREFIVRNIEWIAAVAAFFVVGRLAERSEYAGAFALAAAGVAYWIAKRFEK